MMSEPQDFAYFSKRNAQDRGARIAFTFSNGDRDLASITFAELDQAARAMACALRERRLVNEPVLLLLESSLDFRLRAFHGCLYAGAVAVPVNLPTRSQRLDKILVIAKDAGARVAITSARVGRELAEHGDLTCLDIAGLLADPADAAGAFRELKLDPTAPAFLQYTSGSTGTPKGVVVSHANLIANQAMIRESFGHGDEESFVSWLPLYHDMGLAGAILHATYLGQPCTLMPPLSFVQKPLRWLKLIASSRATSSGGPNFAYDLCVRRVDPAQLEGVDLSSWRVAFNGAEPIRAQTLERFSEKFAPFGFSRRALHPCYGMAEATLFIAGKTTAGPPRTYGVSTQALEQGDVRSELEPSRPSHERADAAAHGPVRELVSCGWGRAGQLLAIVDPETREEQEPGRIGEIWISGPHVASGYWRNPQGTEEAFRAYTRAGAGPFLRTGDLGFVHDGELVVTGRQKDLIIVSGKNHYPQDIESTVSAAHPVFAGRPGAAVALTGEAGEEIALVQELDKRSAAAIREADLVQQVRDAVMAEHGIVLQRVLFIAAGKLPVTTSGKVQRNQCRAMLLRGQFVPALGAVSFQGSAEAAAPK